MSKSILAITVLSILFSASIFSKDKFSGKPSDVNISVSEKESSEKQKEDKSETKKTDSKAVKYIWKDMPSYDRYGNEITPRARENMMKNTTSNKSANENISEGTIK